MHIQAYEEGYGEEGYELGYEGAESAMEWTGASANGSTAAGAGGAAGRGVKREADIDGDAQPAAKAAKVENRSASLDLLGETLGGSGPMSAPQAAAKTIKLNLS